MALKVLLDLETARTQLNHLKTIIIEGIGLLTDAFDLFCVLVSLNLVQFLLDIKGPFRWKG